MKDGASQGRTSFFPCCVPGCSRKLEAIGLCSVHLTLRHRPEGSGHCENVEGHLFVFIWGGHRGPLVPAEGSPRKKQKGGGVCFWSPCLPFLHPRPHRARNLGPGIEAFSDMILSDRVKKPKGLELSI